MAGRIQLRRGTAANWTSANPTLAAGEVGVELDTGRVKVGDGTTAWTSLSYVGGSGTAIVVQEGDSTAVASVSTLDFGAGFDVTETPSGEANITLDLTEYAGGALPITGGGTGSTSASTARAALGAAALSQTINAQTGTTYTLALVDSDSLVTLSNASAVTVTVPPNSSVAFPVGSRVTLAQTGAGQVTIAAGGGVTLRATPSLVLRTQYSVACLEKIATDEWIVVGDLDAPQALNAQTGTTYTLVMSDAQKLVTLSNASAITLTVPTNASVPFPVGQRIDLAQTGAGQVTVAGAGGVTVNATPTLKARAQYSALSIIKTATDTWLLVGDLAAS